MKRRRARDQSSTHIRSKFASDLDTRSNSALLPSRANICRRAVSRSNSSSRRAGSRTKLRAQPTAASALAARHVGDAVERGGGIGDERSGVELEGFLARRAFDRELAAVVARRVGQKQRERHVGAHAAHQRVVYVAAVVHAGLVAGEEQGRERLRPYRQAKHLVAEDALGDELADGFERTVGALGLPVVLDDLRGETSGGPPVDEARACERGDHGRDLLRREHVADGDLHPVSLPAFVVGTIQNYRVTGRVHLTIISMRRVSQTVADLK